MLSAIVALVGVVVLLLVLVVILPSTIAVLLLLFNVFLLCFGLMRCGWASPNCCWMAGLLAVVLRGWRVPVLEINCIWRPQLANELLPEAFCGGCRTCANDLRARHRRSCISASNKSCGVVTCRPCPQWARLRLRNLMQCVCVCVCGYHELAP